MHTKSKRDNLTMSPAVCFSERRLITELKNIVLHLEPALRNDTFIKYIVA